MTILNDLLAHILLDNLTPSGQRGLLLLSAMVGLALGCTNLWLLFTSPHPLREPAWGFVAITSGIVFGLMQGTLSGLHLLKERNDARLAGAALTINIAAVASAAAAATIGQ